MRGLLSLCLFSAAIARPLEVSDAVTSLVGEVETIVSGLLGGGSTTITTTEYEYSTVTASASSTSSTSTSSVVAPSTTSTPAATTSAAMTGRDTTSTSTSSSAPYPVSNSTTSAAATGTAGTTSYTIVSSYPIYRSGSCFTMTNDTSFMPTGTAIGTTSGTAAANTGAARRDGYLYDYQNAKRQTTISVELPTVLSGVLPSATILNSLLNTTISISMPTAVTSLLSEVLSESTALSSVQDEVTSALAEATSTLDLDLSEATGILREKRAFEGARKSGVPHRFHYHPSSGVVFPTPTGPFPTGGTIYPTGTGFMPTGTSAPTSTCLERR